ncbi:hypothetical protein AALP_AA6G164700 [Arabis alpina]|uniref:Uncharacterized protein n=1 Tax=Arabis alpina TaxID=50452 RepID=A0A087GPN4_ARAAL|nr:hypothetical protein AALP_AA6G164700 [Arabis alpina]
MLVKILSLRRPKAMLNSQRCVKEGGPAHSKRFTFGVRMNTSDRGWTDEYIVEPMASVKKAKDSAAVLLIELLTKTLFQF